MKPKGWHTDCISLRALQAQLPSPNSTCIWNFCTQPWRVPGAHWDFTFIKGFFYLYWTLNKPHLFPITQQKRTDVDLPASQQENAAEQAGPSFPTPIKPRKSHQGIPKCRVTTLRCLGALGFGNHFPKICFPVPWSAQLPVSVAVAEEGAAELLWPNQIQMSSPIMNFQFIPWNPEVIPDPEVETQLPIFS